MGTNKWWLNNGTKTNGPLKIQAHMLKNVIPDVKIIVILREPTERSVHIQ
jgi:hypothetical protein